MKEGREMGKRGKSKEGRKMNETMKVERKRHTSGLDLFKDPESCDQKSAHQVLFCCMGGACEQVLSGSGWLFSPLQASSQSIRHHHSELRPNPDPLRPHLRDEVP